MSNEHLHPIFRDFLNGLVAMRPASSQVGTITYKGGDLSCTCGNQSQSDGFVSCDNHGIECEADEHWDGRFLCQRCGATLQLPRSGVHPIFGECISSYTRAQAIVDGVLINLGMFVSQGRPVLELVGFRFPVAITSAAYGEVFGERDGALLESPIITRRVLYFLAVLKAAVIVCTGPDPTCIHFTCTNHDLKNIPLKAVCGPGDYAEPVITVMLPGED